VRAAPARCRYWKHRHISDPSETLISAIDEALRGVGKAVVRNHPETCVTEGLLGEGRQRHYDELMDLIDTLSK
jgi:DNA-binding FrmR family transcriptional regulator